MIGSLITLIFCIACVGLGDLLIRRWTADLDPALRIGLGGLIGLGAVGMVLLPVGLLASGMLKQLAIAVAVAAASVGILGWKILKPSSRFVFSRDGNGLILLVCGICALIAWICSLGPSDSLDWDSLAYHLAVPKLWLQSGKVEYISFIHHSNFPFLVDNLYILGLTWGGMAGAKAFMVAFLAFGAVAVFGFARCRWSVSAGAWAALAFVGIPIVLWESGTAYVDVPHGLYAGLGLLFIARALSSNASSGRDWALAGILLGLGAASKLTGLQMIIAAGVVAIGGLIFQKRSSELKSAIVCGLVAFAIVAPWLAKSAALTGNPVFPFFFERFGGKNWDQFAADIYRDEQQTFGVGRGESGRDLTAVGHAVLGLGYQPGRYVNPMQTEGGGFPTGALGIGVLLGGVAWAMASKRTRFEGAVLAGVGISLAMWFLLSQQSRYLTIIGIPLAILAGGAAASLRIRPVMMFALAGQALYSLYVVNAVALQPKLPAALGAITEEQFYKNQRTGFYFAAQRLNELAKGGKVALFDEVFGYFLDVPYFWANPGHSTEIRYDDCADGPSFAEELRRMKFTHVYMNLGLTPGPDRDRWVQAAGLMGSPQPYSNEEREGMMKDRRTKWKLLLAEAVASGQLRPVETVGGGIIFQVIQP